MKKLISLLIIVLSVSVLSPLAYAEDNVSVCDASEDSLYQDYLGNTAADAADIAISTSMFGWGIGLAIGITILVLIIHQSTAGSAHS